MVWNIFYFPFHLWDVILPYPSHWLDSYFSRWFFNHQWIGFLGKILTGNHRFSMIFPFIEWGIPVNFPLNQSIETTNQYIICISYFSLENHSWGVPAISFHIVSAWLRHVKSAPGCCPRWSRRISNGTSETPKPRKIGNTWERLNVL